MDRPFMTWQHKDILLDEKDEEIKRLKKERDFWKTTVYDVLYEHESGDGVDNEIYEYERLLQQALKEE